MVVILEFAGLTKLQEVENLEIRIEIPFNFAEAKTDNMTIAKMDTIIFPKAIFEHFGKFQDKENVLFEGLPIFECTNIIKANG